MHHRHRGGVAAAALAILCSAVVGQSVQQVGLGGFGSIQAAVDVATEGDVIRVGPGAWPSFQTSKALRIIADPPRAAVVLIGNSHVLVNLTGSRKVDFEGLVFVDSPGGFGGVDCNGGIVSMRDCAIACSFGTTMQNGTLSLSRCTLVAQLAAPSARVTSGHLTASESTFTVVGAPAPSIDVIGSNAEFSRCTLTGAQSTALVPLVAGGPALRMTNNTIVSRTWLVDSTLRGGDSQPGVAGAPAVTTQSTVRTHRSSLLGGNGLGGRAPNVVGTEVPGRLLGISTSPDGPRLGTTFTVGLHGEPGSIVTLYVAFDISTPQPLLSIEQPAFGVQASAVTLANVATDASGTAIFQLPVPANAALLYTPVWFRGVDISVAPLQGSALAFAFVR